MIGQGHNEFDGLAAWEPERFFRGVPRGEVRLSRGFLRCRPERWFPAFAAQWLPIAHALGVELKLLDVKPLMQSASPEATIFVGTVDGETVGLAVDPSSMRVLIEAVTPGAIAGPGSLGGGIVLEYLARRFLTTLSLAWTGPESSVVQFEPELGAADVTPLAEVRFSFAVNGTPCQVSVLLGKFLVERLDALWRRQIQSTSHSLDVVSDIVLEVAQLAVPPSMLAEYLRSGTLIDLETEASDVLVLRAGTKAWQAARGCLSSGRFAFEMIGSAGQSPSLPDGTTRLSISLGATRLEEPLIAELAQAGAMWETTIPVSDRVELRINGDIVGAGRLGLYGGRLAVQVD